MIIGTISLSMPAWSMSDFWKWKWQIATLNWSSSCFLKLKHLSCHSFGEWGSLYDKSLAFYLSGKCHSVLIIFMMSIQFLIYVNMSMLYIYMVAQFQTDTTSDYYVKGRCFISMKWVRRPIYLRMRYWKMRPWIPIITFQPHLPWPWMLYVLLYCWVVRMCVCTSLVCRRLTGKGLTINTLCRVNLSLSVCKYLSRLGKYLEYIPKIW